MKGNTQDPDAVDRALDEEGEESFPASDPPSDWAGQDDEDRQSDVS